VLSPTLQGSITITAGDGQSGPIGGILPIPLEVQVLSLIGNPIEGVEVIFSVTLGDASMVEEQPVLTDVNGFASSQLQLGITPGLIEVAVTARDVNSPLAIFGAEGTGLGIQSLPIDFMIEPGIVGQRGDVSGDGYVDNLDAALVSALAAGALTEFDPVIRYYESADVNQDGAVNSGDALLLHAAQVRLLGY
jgi:hypothetical protein